ncbi:MAG: homocysteine methyltransferase [Epulopiscium sp. Nele67-Bin004]|nr:MAG: homocysteine methyltransferase [Epulopiscium sp. Nele67-Bin004]
MGIRQKIGKERLILDGAMGTMLQNAGLKLGEVPELFNFTNPEIIVDIHKKYLQAGSNIITTNTFGANSYKINDTDYTVEEVILEAVKLARQAIDEVGLGERYVALDIGSTGKLLEPIGDVSFEEMYEVYKEQAAAGQKAGVDIVLLETFTDLYELKCAVLATKENCDLPIMATMSFEANGRTFFGTSLEAMVVTLEGLGVDMLGINCSLGPKELAGLVEELMTLATIPVVVQPNAGLPLMDGDKMYYNITREEFALYIKDFAKLGVSVIGGCCGTEPMYIQSLSELIADVPYKMPQNTRISKICSSSTVVNFEDIRIIGERLNPTGKKRLKEAIKNNEIDYILREAISQKSEGAAILDVNMGLPDIDEPKVLKDMVKRIQGVVDIPLQIDSSDFEAIEQAVRIYNGKPLINSVNAKRKSLDAVLPIAKKYGAAVLGLTLDDTGIPPTAQGRFECAKTIVEESLKIGIPKEDIFIDCLMVTASAQQDQIIETLKAIRLVKENLGVKMVLGVSNVSFGLPNRALLNQTMLVAAMQNGLDAPIMNPNSPSMVAAIDAYRVLIGKDVSSEVYIDKYSNVEISVTAAGGKKSETVVTASSLQNAIIKGLQDEARVQTETMLKENVSALEIIEGEIVPALNIVGKDYEDGKLFLPQLIKAAESAKSSFEVLKTVITKGESSNKVVLATVFGDIHDIGKNIVKVIMENYGFDIIDLGKDVSVQAVVDAIREHNIKVVGLSALMTTTVSSMKDTIAAIRENFEDCKVIVGGAVLTPELAEFVGADFYAKDAMESVRIAEKLFEK